MDLYVWKQDALGAFQPLAELRVEGAAIRVVASADPDIPVIADYLATLPDLGLTHETREDDTYILSETRVAPGAADYPYAVAEAFGKAGAYRVTFSPEVPSF